MTDRTFLTATGRFRIEPPLTWSEFKDSPYRPENERSEPDLLLVVETSEVDGPDGVMLLHRAVAVQPGSPGRLFAYHRGLLPSLQEFVTKHADGHTFTGFFECREVRDYIPTGPWRIVVGNGVVTTVEPLITWPED